MSSTTHTFRETTTTLTGSYVASSSFPIGGYSRHGISIVYNPAEDDGKLSVIVQISDDPTTTTDANSEWRTLGVATRATAVVTYAADTIELAAAAAGTNYYASMEYEGEPGQKIRVQAKETFSGSGTDFGVCRIVGYSYPE